MSAAELFCLRSWSLPLPPVRPLSLRTAADGNAASEWETETELLPLIPPVELKGSHERSMLAQKTTARSMAMISDIVRFAVPEELYAITDIIIDLNVANFNLRYV